MSAPSILARADLARAAYLFADSCRISRDHNKATADAVAAYGWKGAQISGVMQDHFPTFTKDYLRSLARNVGILVDAAYAARPRGVRIETMRRLGRAVAERDGTGFYGVHA